MTALTGDVINRVRRLPKLSNAAEALQPVFEAVSNGIHAIDDAKRAGASSPGIIDINITLGKTPDTLQVTVGDNGIGLDSTRYKAFLTTDTDFKISRGGKGIGRLLWLDAFSKVKVVSTFEEKGKLRRRSFDFLLDKTDQIQNEKIEDLANGSAPSGTYTTFHGLRDSSYQKHFPSQPASIVRRFGSHFLAEFILGNAPTVTVTIGKTSARFPVDIRQMLIEDRGETAEQSPEFGELKVRHFVFRKAASAGFDGLHQLHMIANGRTVTTRKIDGLLGLGRFGEDKNNVYHGCVSGDFLDDRVNQERTHFNFDETVAQAISKLCADAAMREALSAEIATYDTSRLDAMRGFIAEYPSFGFAAVEELLQRTPKNATKGEQFAQALIPTRIRRDADRKRTLERIVTELGGGHAVSGDFAAQIKSAANEVHAEEQRQLTEYILRRKIVLDVLDVLIGRLRQMPTGEEDHHLEATLHTFICPMRIRGDDPNRLETSEHDLWIIDERLAFTKYFASDVPVSQIIADSRTAGRPDVLVWDRLHGLGFDGDEPLRRIMLVEFKKPGRTDYPATYSPENQILRYLKALSAGEIESFGHRIRVASDCVFSCYVIADIVGSLNILTGHWGTAANGRGRWIPLAGKYRGSIEIIEWPDLLADARARNSAFINFTRV